MEEAHWQTPGELRALLRELVSWRSVTTSEGEKVFPFRLFDLLRQLPYFQRHAGQLQLHPVSEGRHNVTALYRHPQAAKTVVLLGHFDTVPTEDFGELEEMATRVDELGLRFRELAAAAPEDVRADILSGEYMFGRGVMDMKMGLALHLAMLEKAVREAWPMNLLFLGVCDEEVNSAGMREAVPVLLELKERFGLEYLLCVLSEPVFRSSPDDEHFSIYTGTVGKILLGALAVGKETHAGEPLSGLSSTFMAGYLTREMEWNPAFLESDLGESTQPPVVLQQKDMLLQYSAQTPLRTSLLYNVFQMKQPIAELFATYEKVARTAVQQLNAEYFRRCRRYKVDPIGETRVIRYADLLAYATEKLGTENLTTIREGIAGHREWDIREKCLRLADSLMMECKELAPAIVLLLAPPYYPAVSFAGNAFIEACTGFLLQQAKKDISIPARRIHYFNGLCDMSYVTSEKDPVTSVTFEENTPFLAPYYQLPFAAMARLDLPTLVIGPYGKDPHKKYERLHLQNALVEMPAFYTHFYHYLMAEWI